MNWKVVKMIKKYFIVNCFTLQVTLSLKGELKKRGYKSSLRCDMYEEPFLYIEGDTISFVASEKLTEYMPLSLEEAFNLPELEPELKLDGETVKVFEEKITVGCRTFEKNEILKVIEECRKKWQLSI